MFLSHGTVLLASALQGLALITNRITPFQLIFFFFPSVVIKNRIDLPSADLERLYFNTVFTVALICAHPIHLSVISDC